MKATQINWRQDQGRERRSEVKVTPGSPLYNILLNEGVKSVCITKFSGDSVTYRRVQEQDPPYQDDDALEAQADSERVAREEADDGRAEMERED